jgi:exodeoxyribonuclease-3
MRGHFAKGRKNALLPAMKIATWNINSVRLRAPIVVQLMREYQPDIICLQETKTIDDLFPRDIFTQEGYAHQYFSGMKSYNGVAILSRIPFDRETVHHRCEKEDCRHVAATFDGFELHNLYIPAGGDEPDPKINEKFDHKLKFVDEMASWFQQNYNNKSNLIAVGDFNIAPFEHDVWSHKQLLKVVSHTPVEVEKLQGMYDSLDWVDAVRHFVPEEKKCYSWWSYRNKDWKKSNRGRRLDHIWVTPPLKPKLKGYEILSHYRDLEKPSDHVPVIVELNL